MMWFKVLRGRNSSSKNAELAGEDMIQQNKSLGTRLAKLSGPLGLSHLEFSTDSAGVWGFFKYILS